MLKDGQPSVAPAFDQAADEDGRRRLVAAIKEMQRTLATNSMSVVELHLSLSEILAAAVPKRCVDDTPRSYTGPEIAAMISEASDPIGLYAERGCIFDMAAPSKVGKTSTTLGMCKAILQRQPFLDLPTKFVPVLYLTEQTRASFKDKLETLGGLPICDDFHVLFIADFVGKSWDEICAVIRTEINRWGIGLVIIDTLSDWAQVKDENDNAEALRVTRVPRAIAQEANVAMFTVRHTGKGRHDNQDVVDVGRGASAYAGVADTLCVLGRTPGQGHSNRRQLRFISRKDNVPASLVFELKGGLWVALGNALNVECTQARDFLLEHLPDCEGDALTEKEILAAADDTFSRRTFQRVLKGERGVGGMLRGGLVTGKKGAGSAGPKAFGYWLRQDDDGEQLGLPDGL